MIKTMSQARELAELIWPEHYCKCNYTTEPTVEICGICEKWIGPKLDTDLNAMRGVWQVLKEKGLWGEFLKVYQSNGDIIPSQFYSSIHIERERSTYHFLFDSPGQVEAAVKVLKRGK